MQVAAEDVAPPQAVHLPLAVGRQCGASRSMDASNGPTSGLRPAEQDEVAQLQVVQGPGLVARQDGQQGRLVFSSTPLRWYRQTAGTIQLRASCMLLLAMIGSFRSWSAATRPRRSYISAMPSMSLRARLIHVRWP